MEEFVERHAQDVAVNRGHAFHFPMLGASREGAVERFDLPNRAFEQGARKCLDISVELLRSKKRLEDVFGSVSAQLPLIHHLESELARFPARSHERLEENRHDGLGTRVATRYFPVNFAGRFSRKARVPSFMSAVVQQRPKSVASSNWPCPAVISMPWLTASIANFTASGALAMIFRASASAAAINPFKGTTWLTRPIR